MESASAYVDRETGVVEVVTSEEFGYVEEDRDVTTLPEWQRPNVEVARRIFENRERYARLPSKFDIHEWSIMQEFCGTIQKDSLREELLHAIHGRGAFRHFKDTLGRHQMFPAWNEYRLQALRDIAAEWCEDQGIPVGSGS